MEICAQEVKQKLYELGADLCGIADVDRFAGALEGYHPLDVLAECHPDGSQAGGRPSQRRYL